MHDKKISSNTKASYNTWRSPVVTTRTEKARSMIISVHNKGKKLPYWCKWLLTLCCLKLFCKALCCTVHSFRLRSRFLFRLSRNLRSFGLNKQQNFLPDVCKTSRCVRLRRMWTWHNGKLFISSLMLKKCVTLEISLHILTVWKKEYISYTPQTHTHTKYFYSKRK